jgi:FkbM family methyltransferase
MSSSQTSSPFGSYRLKGFNNTLQSLAIKLPPTWLGQRFAYIFRKIALKGYTEDTIDAEIDGLKLRLYPFDNLTDRHFLFLPQFFDREEQKFMSKVLSADSTFIDIGGNSGLYSFFAAKKIKHGKILTFEPHPIMSKRLAANISFNSFSHVIKLKDYGIADENKSFEMSINPSNMGGNSIALTHDDKPEYLEEKITIKCRPLLSVLQEEKIKSIDLLKIDIEEAEHLALLPFFETAPKEMYPAHVIIESDDKIDFEKYGYQCMSKTRSHNSLYKLAD